MITLTRKNLSLELSEDIIPAQGSSDVPIQFVNDGETYQNYIIECRVGWYENFKVKSAITQYSDGIIKLPSQAFRYNGRIAIVIALIDNTDSNHIEVTQKVTPCVSSAPLGDVELPENETWQSAVENLVRQLNAQLQIEIDEALKNSQKAIEKANDTNKMIEQAINEGSFIPTITANASVNNTTGTPGVEVEKTGTKENPVFSFNFQNLKGEKGDKGDNGSDNVLTNVVDKQENPSINDSFESEIKDLKLYGKSTQIQQTGIVPTPESPIPIISKKIKVNDEYVELRSLKETGNLFDLVGQSMMNLLFESGFYRKIDIPINIKVNAEYTFSYDQSIIPPNIKIIVNIVDSVGEVIKQVVNLNNLESNVEMTAPKRTVNFVLRKYSSIGFNVYIAKKVDGVLIENNTDVFKEFWYTKILKNIMIYEATKQPTSYIPPTIRDYKIVNHDKKESKIIRNVRQRHLMPVDNFYKSDYGGMEISLKDDKVMKKDESAVTYCNLFNHHISSTIPNNLCYRLDGSFLQFNYEGYNEKTLWDKFITDNELYIQYPLATPTEEPIPYLKTDSSDYGVSFQDDTTPSPSVPSEVVSIEEVDCVVCGENLWDNEKALNPSNWTKETNKFYYYMRLNLKPNTTYTLSVDKNNMFKNYKQEYNGIFALYIGETKSEVGGKMVGNTNIETVYNDVAFTTTNNPIYANCYINNLNIANALSIVFTELLQNIMLVEGQNAEPFTPYREQIVKFTPPQPLQSTLDGKVADEVDVANGVYRYNLEKVIVTGKEVFQNDYQEQKGYYGRYFNNINGNVGIDKKVLCNYLPFINGSWSKFAEAFCQNGLQIHLKFSNERLGITDDTPLLEKRIAFANYLKKLDESENPLYVVVGVKQKEIPIPQETLEQLRNLKTYTGVTNIICNSPVSFEYEQSVKIVIENIMNQLQKQAMALSNVEREVVKNV